MAPALEQAPLRQSAAVSINRVGFIWSPENRQPKPAAKCVEERAIFRKPPRPGGSDRGLKSRRLLFEFQEEAADQQGQAHAEHEHGQGAAADFAAVGGADGARGGFRVRRRHG